MESHIENGFKDIDRWAVIGDSISQNGSYAAQVFLYYATRFPHQTLDFENCGISGDFGSGTLRRYEWDIQPRRATVATIMLGMNDVGRHLYEEEQPSSETLAAREKALEDYRVNVNALTQKLQADGTRVVFVTPSLFDDAVKLETPYMRGVNGALGKCAIFLKEVAASLGATVIDLHGPLTELNLRLQASNPLFSVNGTDRVHPGAAGHFALSYFFLKGQNAPSLVSTVEIDAATQEIKIADNATLSDLTVRPDGIKFQCLEGALPHPIGEDAKEALGWITFHEDFNQEILRVSNLVAGRYSLWIDDEKIGDFSSEELALGLNLSLFDQTPQNRQAAEVLALVEEWKILVAQTYRGIAQTEHWQLQELPHPVSFDEARPRLEVLLTTLDQEKDAYNIAGIERYLRIKPQETQIKAEVDELILKIRRAAQPKPHRFRLQLIPSP